MTELSTLQKDVVELSREIGFFIDRESATFDRSKIEQKNSFRNLVSYVDKEAEKKIVFGLRHIFPGAGILAEEGSNIKGHNEYQWIIDPLDGTTNFFHGLPPYAISIGLAKEKEIVLGVVYEVTRKECFYAIRGGQAYCNEKEISISEATSMHESLLSTGIPYNPFKKQEKFIAAVSTFMQKTHGVRRIGSASVDLAYVACGRLDGFFEYGLNIWDVAAGSLLVEQAGGTVTNFAGQRNFLRSGEICAAGKVHDDMMKVFETTWMEYGNKEKVGTNKQR